MKRIIIYLIAICGILILAAGCSHTDVEEAQVEFCQALDHYREAVSDLQDINEQTTINELNGIRANVSDSRDNLLESATVLRAARLNYVEDAWANLEQDLDGIPGDATLGEAANYARIETATLLTEIDRVTNVSCGRR